MKHLHDGIRSALHGHHASPTADRAVLTGRHADLYDRVAARWVLRPLYRAAAADIAAAVPQGGSVLDVGTGPGRLLIELARRRPDLQLVGIDPSPDMVAHAHRNARDARLRDRVDVRVAAAESLPFDDGSFDAVASTLSAHHWSDVTAAVAEQARVLRAGGRLWVFDLRRTSAALSAALSPTFPAAQIGRPDGGRLAAALVVRHCAEKAARPSDA